MLPPILYRGSLRPSLHHDRRQRILKELHADLRITNPMASPAHTLLTFWVIVVATGTVVTHEHTPKPGHTHGFGWTSLSIPFDRAELPFRHRHFVLLGVELEALPGESDECTPDATVSAIDTAAPTACAEPENPLSDAGSLWDSTSNSLDFRPPITHFVAPADTAGICPLISHLRSGVLRI